MTEWRQIEYSANACGQTYLGTKMKLLEGMQETEVMMIVSVIAKGQGPQRETENGVRTGHLV